MLYLRGSRESFAADETFVLNQILPLEKSRLCSGLATLQA